MSEEQNIIKRPLAIEDLQQVEMLSGASLSADSKLLAYVTTKVVPEENVHKDFITIINPLSKQVISVWEGSAPQWSPVTNEIAYLAEFNNLDYLWIYSLDTEVHKPLAPVYESHYFMGHLSVKEFRWSPDGRQLAYISTEPYPGDKSKAENVVVLDRLLYKTKGGRVRPVNCRWVHFLTSG